MANDEHAARGGRHFQERNAIEAQSLHEIIRDELASNDQAQFIEEEEQKEPEEAKDEEAKAESPAIQRRGSFQMMVDAAMPN